eukprot:scaffold4880_cov106-Cylindrotheca_fusiformis.AAC.7
MQNMPVSMVTNHFRQSAATGLRHTIRRTQRSAFQVEGWGDTSSSLNAIINFGFELEIPAFIVPDLLSTNIIQTISEDPLSRIPETKQRTVFHDDDLAINISSTFLATSHE